MSLPMQRSAVPGRSDAMPPPPPPPPLHPTLVVSIDIGTTSLSGGARIRRPGMPVLLEEVVQLKLGIKNKVPLVFGFDYHNNFVWGDDVADALLRKRMDPEKVIEVLQLSLFKSHATSEIAMRVEHQLKRMETTKVKILSLLIRAVIQEAQKHAEKVRGTWQGLDGMDIDDLQVELFLTIPDMWKPPANRYMTRAAEMAGVRSVQLTTESLCAAAYFMHDAHKSTRRSLNPGEAILVVDAGGGTTDVTRFEMPASGNAGAVTKLRRTGAAKGDLAGSHLVNVGFSKWLILEADINLGGFSTKVTWLGYGGAPYAGFYRAANEAFDKAKLDFLPGAAYSGANTNIIVPGSPTSDATMNRTWHIVLPCAKMKGLFDKVIDDNSKLIAPMITPNTVAMVMPGGFADSQYFRHRLQALLEPAHPGLKIDDGDTLLLTRHQSVATGALLRYAAVVLNAASRVGCFGVATDEQFDVIRHPDGIIKAGTTLITKRTGEYYQDRQARPTRTSADIINRKVVVESEFTDGLEAVARFDPILPTAEANALAPDEERVSGIWQTRYIEVTDKSQLVFQTYWTDDPKIKAGSAIFENGPEDGVLKFEVEPWGPPICVDCPDFKALGFPVLLAGHKKIRVYQITYLIEVKERGPNASLKVRMVMPTGRQPLDEHGNPLFAPGNLPDDVHLRDIVDENMDGEGCLPFPRN